MTCKHIELFGPSLKHVLETFVYNAIFPLQAPDRFVMAESVLCEDCGDDRRLIRSIFVCCCCAKFACIDHLRIHSSCSKSLHIFAACTESGRIYCHVCRRFIYDEKFDRLRREKRNASLECLGLRGEYISLLKSGSFLNLPHYLRPNKIGLRRSARGLRGLVNLGNTCFMNTVLQTFLHAPFLRPYYLSCLHSCNRSNHCLVCELLKIFQAFYSGATGPYRPKRFVYLFWRSVECLAYHRQQDAHEFLQALLGVLCSSKQHMSDTDPCDCIIDQLFRGTLQSKLCCPACNLIKRRYEAFYDLSLALGKEDAPLESVSTSPFTLEGILRSYITPELCSLETKCSQCPVIGMVTQQLTFTELPKIICFHLKRWCSNGEKKNDTVLFPQSIDMTPYTTDYQGTSFDNGEMYHAMVPDKSIQPHRSMDVLFRDRHRYKLFAVINHKGTKESGHYTCYVFHRGHWFFCDDAIVLLASIDEVLQSEAYLLLYAKCELEFS